MDNQVILPLERTEPKIEPKSEQEIVALAKIDFQYFGQLYRLYFKKIYAYVFTMLRQHEAAEDVVSLTFEKAMQKISQYQDQGFSFGAWLYRIARNTALDYIHDHSKLTPYDPESVIFMNASAPGNPNEEYLERTEMWQAVLELDEDSREVLQLRYIEGYSIKETAKIVGRTEDSVKSTAKRALKKLKSKLIPLQANLTNQTEQLED